MLKSSSKVIAKLFIFTLLLSPFIYCIDTKSQVSSQEELAYYWAPIIYQDTDNTNFKADFLTKFNYDNNWIGNDNWENLESYPLDAYIYYSIVETETHLFLGYYTFHPRDWLVVDIESTSHENDLEGVLIVIKKDSSWGQFLCMVTRAHVNFYQYKDYNQSPSSGVSNGHEDIDGDIEFELVSDYETEFSFESHEHPIVYVDCWGHGVYGDKRWESDGFPGGDGVKYSPKGIAEVPSNGNDPEVSYKLLKIEELWDRRFNAYGSGETFGNFTALDGNTYGDDKALAPWGWDDDFDGPTFTGEFFYNPIDLVNTHFSNLGYYEFRYIYNPYVVMLKFDKYRVLEDRDGFNDESDGYFNLYMFDGDGRYKWPINYDDGVLDGNSGTQASWKIENMVVEEWYPLEDKRPLYGIRCPNRPFFGIRSMDWDDASADEWLMDDELIHWYGPISSTLPEDGGLLYTIVEGYRFLDWGKSEVYLYLYIENEEYFPFSNSPTNPISISYITYIPYLVLFFLFYFKRRK